MSSTSARTFEFKDDKSSKFWKITQAGSTVTVRYGKTGTNGQTQEKVFDDASAASRHVAKLITEKTGKGYLEVGSSPSADAEKSVSSDEGLTAEGVAKPPAKTKAPKSADAKPNKPKNPAQDPEVTPESLLLLLDKDDTTNRLLARHPKASVDLLEKLSHSSDKATRRGVAANPNTLPETYVKLGQQFPK
jgi:predicted DNA-binding WGR domain protein